MTMFYETPSFWGDRCKASAVHLCLSLCIAAMAGLLVFTVWYPHPYREISGGRELFFILVAVDVVLGPLITLAVFNRRKPRKELQRDLGIVCLIQLAALGYGLWTVAVARPVHMVFEYKIFRVVHAIDVPRELLSLSPPGVNALPITGPTVIGLRPFKDSKESFDATVAAMQGVSLSARPDLWQPYEKSVQDVLNEAKPAIELLGRFHEKSEEINLVLSKVGRKSSNTMYIPLASRKAFWTAFIDPITAEIVATMPLDSF